MPLTVITIKNSPQFLRGDLTKWMQEISTGVYVGNFNTKIRKELWKRIVDNIGKGEATISYAFSNEIGYKFETHNSKKIPIDFDGIPLVFTPISIKNNNIENRYGFSNAAKLQKVKKYGLTANSTKEEKNSYVILDLETTGLDPIHDLIIEIGAIKIAKKTEEYKCIINQNIKIPDIIKELTGINEEDMKNGKEEFIAIDELIKFIGNKIIVGYNVNFDIKFINETLKRQGKNKLTNISYDVMKYVKKEKMFLKNYKLETVLKEYGINSKVPHRAMEDAKIIQMLTSKIKTLMDKLKKI